MDPLSDVVSLLRPQTYVTGGLSASGAWGVRFPTHNVIKCYSVIKGECWLSVENVSRPIRLQAGSFVLLPRGWPFVLASDLSLPHRDSWELLSKRERYNGILPVSPGDDFLVLGSHFEVDRDVRFLLDVLPPIVMLENEAQKKSLRWGVARILREMRDPQPGGTLIAQQIAYTILVEALRLHMADDQQRSPGWLSALADRRMRAALSSMHNEPGRVWTVRELARCAGMSRTAFAQVFKRSVGKSPLGHLTHWRMTVAAKQIQNGGQTVSSIAPALGYKSESAFRAAFRRHWGTSPREHIRAQGAASL